MKKIDPKFEKFLGGPTQPTQERLYVSIAKSGKIALNSNCYRELGKPPAVYLHFSRSDSTIGIEPVQSYQLPAAFPVKENGKSGRRINAAPFCRHWKIRIDTTERFVSPEIRDGLLYLKLSETVIVRQHRRKTKADK